MLTMRSTSVVIGVAASLLVSVMAEPEMPIEFTNTSFTDLVAIGSTWPISWTTGNGYEITLSVENETWAAEIFSQEPVLPSMYMWTVGGDSSELTPGNYQLRLTQTDGEDGGYLSPEFAIVAPDDASSSSSTSSSNNSELITTTTDQQSSASTSVPDMTVTYTYWDSDCGCHKTTSGPSGMGTEVGAYTTSTWYEMECGCTKSAVVPLPTNQPVNNYTAPTAPKSASASVSTQGRASQSRIAPSSTSNSANYTGTAIKLSTSLLGVIIILVGVVLF